jgi:ubiquinone/menaquinone biosynthesis C-methylase UbiE/DNA-binding transcriptional ArsR family regulator
VAYKTHKDIFMSDIDAPATLPADAALAALRGAGEETRLRILSLLAGRELNVKDLTQILGQSQPRISRHLKLLFEAGLITRFREGSWVFFRLAEQGALAALVRSIVASLDSADPVIQRDEARAEQVAKARAEAAQNYFKAHAGEWDRIRSLHVAEEQVEAAMQSALGQAPFELLVDLGTGTGRILELFAPQADRALGFDVSHDMLAMARVKLDRAGLSHAQARYGDLFNVPLTDDSADAVVLHQVLHFLDDPALAIQEAARLLKPGGKLLIVDFAPHAVEFLREEQAHRRLGFAQEQLDRWLAETGLAELDHRSLAPSEGEAPEKLTVSLWLAEKPGLGERRAPASSVEVAA